MSKMTIKEAGRYANFLESMINEAIYLSAYGGLDSKMKTVTELHKKSEAYSEAEDKEVIVEFTNDIDVEIEDLNKIVDSLVEEKIALSDSIAKAKKEIVIPVDKEKSLSLDSSIEYAKLLRNIVDNYYSNFLQVKGSKEERRSQGYAFNVEGNQVPYYYNVEIETELKFDKETFVKKSKLNRELSDKVSNEIEKAMTREIVSFTPKYSYLDKFEELIKS